MVGQKILVFFVCVQILVGCAGVPVVNDAERVSLRAQAHQNALLINDFKEAYTFLSPEYRASRPYRMYLGTKGAAVKRESASIHSVECEDRVCTVLIDLYYRYQGLGGMHIKDSQPSNHRVNEEKWVKVDGEWWLYEK